MTETTLCRLLRGLFGGAAASLAVCVLPAAAQTQAPQADAPIPRVEITGSNIRRAQSETASAVLTVNRADIERSGKSSVAELLQTLAVDNQGSVPTSFGNGFAAGASGISLRGLGAASTLVLLNGRRMAPYGLADDGQKQFSDLNVIPTDAVERIEILKDGASAIYGSDAIAGVVNVILRRDYQGTTVRGLVGLSQEHDGRQVNAAFTHGVGDLDKDRYNLLFSLEYKKNEAVWLRDRRDREHIGRVDLRRWGYSAQEALGGTGAITGNNAGGSAVNGNVRNPVTLDYYNRGNPAGAGFTRVFPGAACSNFTSHPQGDPGGGCLIDATLEYNQIQPQQENLSFFTRGTLQITPDLQAYSELNYYTSQSGSSTTPTGISGSVGYPGGPVSNAAVALGASHPDNPYFGSAARLRYLAADVGPRRSTIPSLFVRWVGGIKGSNLGWDWDTALLFSRSAVSNRQTGYLQRDVAFALLNPTPANVAAARAGSAAYAALPAGSLWRIGENAGLNSAALYAALSPEITNDASSKVGQLDFKASREFAGLLPGGALGVALGGEWRHEAIELRPTTGTERGNVIGLGYSAYSGGRNVFALYGEALAPVIRNVELSAALRWDHFTDVGNSYTPKAGIKWTPLRQLALRATWARGFRAPSPAENGAGGLAAFSTADDPARCALGVTAACSPASVALITSPNPNLQPERSRNYNLGIIWDPLPRTSVSVDYWQIKRSNEINQNQVDAAIAAGDVSRDPSTATSIPGDPGAITAVLNRYVNSAQSKVRGIDLDARQSFALPNNWGNLIFDAKWTHLYEWLRTEQDGSARDFAGTHGNCDVTNCIGTPNNRANLRASWERNDWRVTANLNYRGKLDNTLYKGDPDGCASHLADGSDAPSGCELASFSTVDLVLRWKPLPKWEVFGSVQNLFDRVAPLDPLTYGAQAYNPLDYAGAVGRYFTLGARYSF
ncbi:TonB-dependent receptor [Massilia sp. S19_KUP03_FR1]|uniref:TonB-dependent receptor n=1 Tax=Massilia sp. S19_KUP03_FR1 TaxID=3025503 RepID=UPI002FCDCAF1